MGIYKTDLEWIEKNANHYDVDDIVSILDKYEKNFNTESAKVLKEMKYLLTTSKNVGVTRAVSGIFCKYIKVQKHISDVKDAKGSYINYELQLPISDELKQAIDKKYEECKNKAYFSSNVESTQKSHCADLDLDKFERNKKLYSKRDILTIIYRNKMHCSKTINALEYLMLQSHNKKFEAFATNCFRNYASVKKIDNGAKSGKNYHYEIDAQLPQEVDDFVAKTYFDLKCEDEYFNLADCTFLQNLR